MNELLSLTAEIVAAHVANNRLATNELPGLIHRVYATLASVDRAAHPAGERPLPAVPVKRSVAPDYLICLEDGRRLKMLKRHLRTAYDLTPAAYREKWGLPADYPMVAPNYAKERSKLAKKIGLGTLPRRRRRPLA